MLNKSTATTLKIKNNDKNCFSSFALRVYHILENTYHNYKSEGGGANLSLNPWKFIEIVNQVGGRKELTWRGGAYTNSNS